MALAATMVWQVQNGGSDTTCSGGFNAARGGTDYTLQNSAQATGTATSATTTVTATSAIFTAQMVGNTITDGTTIKEITAFTSSTIVTVDSAPSWTAATIYVGGGLASPGKASGYMVADNIVYIKYSATVYSITTATTGVSGGCLALGSSATYCGYNTTRSLYNTDALQPTLQISSGLSATTIFTATNNPFIQNLVLDGNLQTTSKGAAGGNFWRCTFMNFTNGATTSSAGTGSLQWCYITGCTTVTCTTMASIYCWANANTVLAFGSLAFRCISSNNTGATTDGFSGTAAFTESCIAYANGRRGFVATSNSQTFFNCIAENNGAFGFFQNTAGSLMTLINCASYNNTSGRLNTVSPAIQDIGPITGSAEFFVNAAGNNFAFNNTAGGGALFVGAAFPSSLANGATANYEDLGPAQSQPAATVYHVINKIINNYFPDESA